MYVHLPSDELLGEKVDEDEQGSVTDSLGELVLSLLGNVEALNVLLGLVKSGVLELVSGSRNEDPDETQSTRTSVS